MAKPTAMSAPPPTTMVRSPRRATTGAAGKAADGHAAENMARPLAAPAGVRPLTVAR